MLVVRLSDIVLPKPSVIIITLIARMPALWPHILQTLYTTRIGFGLGIAIGIALGVLVGSSRLAYDVAYPLLIGFATIPKVAVVPIFVLWFGAGGVPAMLTAMIMCIFPIVVNVATGLATTEPELEDVMRALHASKLEILWNVGLPRTIPYFFGPSRQVRTSPLIPAKAGIQNCAEANETGLPARAGTSGARREVTAKPAGLRSSAARRYRPSARPARGLPTRRSNVRPDPGTSAPGSPTCCAD